MTTDIKLDLTLPTTFAEFSEWNVPGWDMFKSDPFKSSDGVPLVLGVTAAGGGTVLRYSSGTSVLLVGPHRVGPLQWNDKEFLQWLEKAMDEYPSAVHPKLREAWHRSAVGRVNEAFKNLKIKNPSPLPFTFDEIVSAPLKRGDPVQWAPAVGSALADFKRLGDEGAQIRKDFESSTSGSASNATPLKVDGKPLVTGVRIVYQNDVETSNGVYECSYEAASDLEAAKNILAVVKPDFGPKEHVRVVRAVVFEGTYEAVQAQIKASLPVGDRGNVHSSSACKITIAQGEIERVLPPGTLVEGY